MIDRIPRRIAEGVSKWIGLGIGARSRLHGPPGRWRGSGAMAGYCGADRSVASGGSARARSGWIGSQTAVPSRDWRHHRPRCRPVGVGGVGHPTGPAAGPRPHPIVPAAPSRFSHATGRSPSISSLINTFSSMAPYSPGISSVLDRSLGAGGRPRAVFGTARPATSGLDRPRPTGGQWCGGATPGPVDGRARHERSPSDVGGGVEGVRARFVGRRCSPGSAVRRPCHGNGAMGRRRSAPSCVTGSSPPVPRWTGRGSPFPDSPPMGMTRGEARFRVAPDRVRWVGILADVGGARAMKSGARGRRFGIDAGPG